MTGKRNTSAPEAMRQPVASAIPTLLISGSFDTLTSLAGAKAAAVRLSSATIISIPGIGHPPIAHGLDHPSLRD